MQQFSGKPTAGQRGHFSSSAQDHGRQDNPGSSLAHCLLQRIRSISLHTRTSDRHWLPQPTAFPLKTVYNRWTARRILVGEESERGNLYLS